MLKHHETNVVTRNAEHLHTTIVTLHSTSQRKVKKEKV